MRKEYNRILPIIIVMIFMSMVYIFFIRESKNSVESFAKKGVINFEKWNWNENEIVQLKGQWNIYPNSLKNDMKIKSNFKTEKVPGSWEDYKDLKLSSYGCCTYSLVVKGLEPLKIYGIELEDEVTSYNLFANNKKIACNGIVSYEKKNYKPEWNPTTSVFQADDKGEVKFIMEIANFDYYTGGFWNSIKIGQVKDILDYTNKNKARDMFLFSSIFIIGFFSLGLFFIYKKDKTTVYFSILCFTLSLRILLTNERIISDMILNLSWYVLIKLEFLTAYTLMPTWGLFIAHLFQIKKYIVYMKRFFYCYIIFSFSIVLFTHNKIYSLFMEFNKWITIIFAICFLVYSIKINVERKKELEIIFYGVFCIIISIFQETFIRGPVSWVPFASLNFVLCCLILTLNQFFRIIRKKDILEAQVILDPLTHLYNRNYLNKIKDDFYEKSNNEKKYCMFLDLDHFKYINDTFGHKIGDFVLYEVGERLKLTLSDIDSICRYGGDEFIIILSSKCDMEIEKIANKIIDEIKKPFIKDEKKYFVGVSIGIAKENKMLNMESLIKKSDKAMYIAKKSGGNRYYFFKL